MKTVIAFGISLILFEISDSWIIKGFTIAYLIFSLLLEVYVLGDEKTR